MSTKHGEPAPASLSITQQHPDRATSSSYLKPAEGPQALPVLDLRQWCKSEGSFWGILPKPVGRLPSKKNTSGSTIKPLSPGAKVLYSSIATRLLTQDAAFPSMKTLARDSGISAAQARRYVQELEEYPLLRVTRRPAKNNMPGLNDSNMYELLQHPIFNDTGTAKNASTPRNSSTPENGSTVLPRMQQPYSQEWQSIKINEKYQRVRTEREGAAHAGTHLSSPPLSVGRRTGEQEVTQPRRTSAPRHGTRGTDEDALKCWQEFWSQYPRQVQSEAGLRAFLSLYGRADWIPDRAYFLESVLPGLKRYCVSEEWARDDGKYIPAPHVFLAGDGTPRRMGRMWLDNPKPSEEHRAELRRQSKSRRGIDPYVEFVPERRSA
jgi:Helix-turn-helix domain